MAFAVDSCFAFDYRQFLPPLITSLPFTFYPSLSLFLSPSATDLFLWLLNYSIIEHNNNFVLGKCRAKSFLSAWEIRKLHLRFITTKVATLFHFSPPPDPFPPLSGKTKTQIKQTFNHSGKRRQQKFLRCAKLSHRPSLSLILSFRSSFKKPTAKFGFVLPRPPPPHPSQIPSHA